jgi:hypothetical protein
MKITVFWDVASPSRVDIDRIFRGAYCLLHQFLGDVDLISRRLHGATSQKTVIFTALLIPMYIVHFVLRQC